MEFDAVVTAVVDALKRAHTKLPPDVFEAIKGLEKLQKSFH
jgi:tartrate dehydratase alpha subunit/fumarate hydratase class I-like protein